MQKYEVYDCFPCRIFAKILNMKAAVFPGQGAQFVGMGKDLFERSALARTYFEQANEILGFDITAVMFEGDEQALKRTEVTQPAIFIHSVIAAKLQGEQFKPDMVAGHSLGEFSALVAAGALSFEDGLSLVAKRANAMQDACGLQRGTMAAVLGLDDAIVEQTCQEIEGIVVAANYNCPGQLVISGDYDAVEKACEVLKERGAKRALLLPVGGAFHSPLMAPAKQALAAAIEQTDFKAPLCPIYQNVSAQAVSDPAQIKQQLIEQLTAPVRWTQSIEQMIADGATEFTEYGPGKVLQGLIKKIDRNAEVASA